MKKKGFTLIELLAVIIVIAVIAIITVPTILGVIDKSRKAAYKDSIYGIIDSARIYLTMNQENIKANEEIEFVCNGIACSRQDNGDNLLFKGTVPKSGSIYLQADGSILVESVYNGKYYANNETGEVVITEDDTTLTRGELTELVKELQQKYDNLKNEVTTLNSRHTTDVTNVNNKVDNLAISATSIDKVYPVGSIYISTSNVDPANLFKGTTWERYAENRTLVGTNGTAGQTGGNSSITLAVGQLPSHNHTIPALGGSTNITGNHQHASATGGNFYSTRGRLTKPEMDGVNAGIGFAEGNANGGFTRVITDITGNHSHTVTTSPSNTGNTGTGSAINIMNPYITVYMWKRTG